MTYRCSIRGGYDVECEAMREYFVYILANAGNSVMYVGVTNDLGRRIQEHREGLASEFTRRYKAVKLVYYEQFEHVEEAIGREKQLKNWRRKWKGELVESVNPEWRDLSADGGF